MTSITQLATHLDKKLPTARGWMFYFATTLFNLNSLERVDLNTLEEKYLEAKSYNLEKDPGQAKAHPESCDACYAFLKDVISKEGPITVADWKIKNLPHDRLYYLLETFLSYNRYAVTPVIDLSFVDISHLTDLTGLFAKLHVCGIAYQYAFDVSAWDTSHVQVMDRLFANCEVVVKGYGKWDLSSLRSVREMFKENRVVDEDIVIDLSKIKSSGLVDVFKDSEYLLTKDLSKIFINVGTHTIPHSDPDFLKFHFAETPKYLIENLKRNTEWLREHHPQKHLRAGTNFTY